MRRTLARPEMTSVGGSDVAEINNQSIRTPGVAGGAAAADLPRFLLSVARRSEVARVFSGVCFAGDYSITVLSARADSQVTGPWLISVSESPACGLLICLSPLCCCTYL